jgi:P4 family phage/plasmid primase-like protien
MVSSQDSNDITRFELLEAILPFCDQSNAALMYPKGERGLGPGWVTTPKNVNAAVDAYRSGSLRRCAFESVTKAGKPYRIECPERLGLVPHRDGQVRVFCVDFDDHTGDGGNVGMLVGIERFLGANGVVFTSKGGKGQHCFFLLANPMPVADFIRWAKAWGFNRQGGVEVFPKTDKLTQIWLPNEPNPVGGDTYVHGSTSAWVVDKLPQAPTARLTTDTLRYLMGLVGQPGRNKALNRAAFELARKEVSTNEAQTLCDRGSVLCDLQAKEPAQCITTFESGYSAGRAGPNSTDSGGNASPLSLQSVRDVSTGLLALGNHDPLTGSIILSQRKTLPSAQAFLKEFHTRPDGLSTLRFFAGEFYQWRFNRYECIEPAALIAAVLAWLDKAVHYQRQRGTQVLVPFPANPATARAVVSTLEGLVHLTADTPVPGWIDESCDWPAPRELFIGLTSSVHLPTGMVVEPTPRLFNLGALEFDYDTGAAPPILWLKFLEEIFGDDPEALQLLQEWFGYCLMGDTSQQKMILIVGPPRSGKGTMARVIEKLLGPRNVVGPTASSLAQNFGLQPLIGKSLAIISDARFRGRQDAALERLLSISGEDAVSVDRKYLTPVNIRLPVRFMLLSNELPQFIDASGAIANRFMIVRLTKSFLGHENRHLTEELCTELPGILNWAIEGWFRLHERGNFVQPASGREAQAEMEDLASPVVAFVRDLCITSVGSRVLVDPLFGSWNEWCEREGIVRPGSKQQFGRDLRAVIPNLKIRRDTLGKRFYEGVSLK